MSSPGLLDRGDGGAGVRIGIRWETLKKSRSALSLAAEGLVV